MRSWLGCRGVSPPVTPISIVLEACLHPGSADALYRVQYAERASKPLAETGKPSCT